MKHTFTVDASHNQESGKIGIGILIQETTAIARRKRGQIIDTLFESFTPDEIYHGDMELYAIYRSFQIAIDRGYRHIHVRTDYNWNKRRINKALKAGSQSDDSSLFQKTLTLARAIEQVKVSYLPRRKNQIAHQLARKGAGISSKPKERYDKTYFDEFSYYQYYADENLDIF